RRRPMDRRRLLVIAMASENFPPCESHLYLCPIGVGNRTRALYMTAYQGTAANLTGSVSSRLRYWQL
ncbi:MAG: hypothetical protein VX624_17815, partial [Pseudomonadota bacterium]|nr:hypothetical protein [Pseudomonadota bacterium]